MFSLFFFERDKVRGEQGKRRRQSWALSWSALMFYVCVSVGELYANVMELRNLGVTCWHLDLAA